MTKVKITDPMFMGETGVVEYVCTGNQHPTAKIKVDSTGESVMMFLDEFEVIKEER